MARLVWTDRGVQFIDVGPPEEVAVAEVSFGQSKIAAKVIVRRRRRGKGKQPDVVEEEEVRVEKEKGKLAKTERVSKGALA